MIDETLELFKGQLSLNDLKDLSLREIFSLRDSRVERLEAERKYIEEEQRNKNG